MILSQLSSYLRDHRRASVADITIRLNCNAKVLESMLVVLERKGRVRRLPVGVTSATNAASAIRRRVRSTNCAATSHRERHQRHHEAMNHPFALLAIGIHHEQLFFGREVMAQLELDRVKVLEVPEGISGRRPIPDERFHYDALHRALYSQLLPHMRRSYRLLIDLHVGSDKEGPSADIMTGDLALHERLQAVLSEATWKGSEKVRILALGQQHEVCTQTAIPERIWNNQEFAYVGVAVYRPESEAGHGQAVSLARFLVNMVLGCGDQSQRGVTKAPDKTLQRLTALRSL